MITDSVKTNIFKFFYIYNIIFILLSICFVYCYVSILKLSHKAEKDDLLNIKLLELDICGWNLLHIIFYFSICYIFNITTIIGYTFVFLIGIVWFFLEKYLFSNYNKNFIENNNKKNYVYSSISHPRYDDFIFNFLGILFHFISQNYCFNTK